MPEGGQSRRQRRYRDSADREEYDQLNDINRVDHPRCTEAVLCPFDGQNPHPLHQRLLQEGVRINVRKIGLGESHVSALLLTFVGKSAHNIRYDPLLYTVANRQSRAALLSLKDNTASNVIVVKKSGLDTEVEVTSYVAEVASRLNGRVVELSSALGQSLEDQIPELRGDAALVELLGTSVEGNVDTVLHALRYDIAVERVEAPTAALEYARRLAQRGVAVNALVRAYRLGQRQINEVVFAELRVIDIPEAMRVEVIEAITGTLFEYIDWMSQQVVAVYEDERERWLENQNSLRALRVREVLAANKSIEADAASTVIRYPLRWHHLGLVMWYPDAGTEGDQLARLQRFLRELAESAGAAAAPLFVAADRGCGWGWRPFLAAGGAAPR